MEVPPVSRPPLVDRVREAVLALAAAQERQLTLPGATAHLGESVEELVLAVFQHLTAIHQLSQAPTAAQRLLREGHCADASILLALVGAHPATHA
jgi:hypothetical protein